MFRGELDQRTSEGTDVCRRESRGDDENAAVWMLKIPCLHRQRDEVVPVPGDEAEPFTGGEAQMIWVAPRRHSFFVSRHYGDARPLNRLSNGERNVLVEVVPLQAGGLSRAAISATRSSVYQSFRAIRASTASRNASW